MRLPTAAEMIPQSRHYIDRQLIFEAFKSDFEDYHEFLAISSIQTWQSLGAEKYSKTWFVPGSKFQTTPYQLKDAVALGALLFNQANALATRSALLFHFNHNE